MEVCLRLTYSILTLCVPRADGGLEGECRLPLLADRSGKICKKYGVFDADEGVARKALVVIDTTGQLKKLQAIIVIRTEIA